MLLLLLLLFKAGLKKVRFPVQCEKEGRRIRGAKVEGDTGRILKT